MPENYHMVNMYIWILTDDHSVDIKIASLLLTVSEIPSEQNTIRAYAIDSLRKSMLA